MDAGLNPKGRKFGSQEIWVLVSHWAQCELSLRLRTGLLVLTGTHLQHTLQAVVTKRPVMCCEPV